ncbi:MAG: hypothetical protein K9N21_19985 [Deltaproteobacteria bacterium]|nr:hypothetical protein [Deltaproteobacteria bacterium]
MRFIHARAGKLLCVALWSFVLCIAFNFTYAYAYPAPKFQRAMVFSMKQSDGTILSIFFAVISGPSPEDVTSFTATGPSGTYNLNPSRSFQQYGLYYVYGEQGVLEDGTYTLTVTDSAGRSASVSRDFTYDGSVPKPTNLDPANESYTEGTTPTLSFSPVEGDYIYQVIISDYDSKAIWYISPMMTTPSFTVPEGMLQRNTAYSWEARIYDASGRNCSQSQPVFYTDTKTAPEIMFRGVMSFPTDSNFLNFLYAQGSHVAPWDIDYFHATGPDNTVYDLNRRAYQFTFSSYNANITAYDPPASVPDGTYTFEIKDDQGRTNSDTCTYTYNPVPDFVEDSRLPADNAYLDTDKPTFSWSRVEGDTGNGAYLYSIRIVDYSTGVRFFDSPQSTETSFTPSESLNLPRGSSYKWRVNVIDNNGNNYRTSSSPTFRTLTFNPESAPSVLYVSNTDDTCNGNDPCYTSIQDAIDYAGENASIRLAEGTYNEIFELYLPKSITLKGGWDISFENQTATTTLRSAPKAPQGSLTLQELIIKPE